MDTKSKKWRPALSFAAFVVGISLLLTSVPSVVLTIANGTVQDFYKADFQQTSVFHRYLSQQMQEFIDMGTGRMEEWRYYTDYAEDYAEDYVFFSSENTATEVTTGKAEAGEQNALRGSAFTRWAASQDGHNYYKDDKNVLYRISYDGKPRYSNMETGETPGEDYTFQMEFQNGAMSYNKVGSSPVNLSEKYYQEGMPWDLPGYRNRPASTEQEKVTVNLWVSKTPARYTAADGTEASNTLYYVQRDLQRQAAIFQRQSILLVLGLVLFLLSLGWKQRHIRTKEVALWYGVPAGNTSSLHAARAAIARWTGKAPFEIKGLVLLIATLAVPLSTTFLYWAREFRYAGWEEMGYVLPRMMEESMQSSGAFLCFFWVVYLLVNDCCFNGKPWKHNLLHKLCAAMRENRMRHPVVQRLNRINWSGTLASTIALGGAVICYWCYIAGYDENWLRFACLLLGILGIWIMLVLSRDRQMIADMGKMAEQIKAVHAGEMVEPLTLSPKSELADVLGALNDIQSGMREAVEERLKSEMTKVELITNVSHDIKTPLTSIVSYIDLLKQEEELPAHVKEYVKILDQKAARLRTMVQDVVEVSKAASGQLPVRTERLDLAKLLRQTLADMGERIDAAPVTVRAEIPEAPVPIEADGDRLYRVFQNLIGNALQYSLAGSRIYVTLRENGTAAVASVKNISANELLSGMDFTERFVRGDESRTDGGSGLGLSIAASFTEACGGVFHIETEADLFTAVVEFPVLQKEGN